MDFTNGEFEENQARVSNLIQAAQRLDQTQGDMQGAADDVLRAAVVILHSSLEEVIRNLFLTRLPNASEETLNKIPIASQRASARPEKFLLGNLLPFQGRLVENVIRDSITAYVDTFSLNNTTQLVTCLEMASLSPERLRPCFPELDAMMSRRHQIVHQMDRTNSLDPLVVPVSEIDAQTVLTWKNSVEVFFQGLEALVNGE